MSSQDTCTVPTTSGRSGLDLGQLARRPELGSLLGLLAVYIFFAVLGGEVFLSPAGSASWLNIAAEIGIIALPVGLLMIAGELDISVGAVVPHPVPLRPHWLGDRTLVGKACRMAAC